MRGESLQLLRDQRYRLVGQEAAQRLDLALDAVRIEHQAIKRDQRRDRGRDGQEAIERGAGGDQREIVAGDIVFRPHHDVPPAAPRDLARRSRGPTPLIARLAHARLADMLTPAAFRQHGVGGEAGEDRHTQCWFTLLCYHLLDLHGCPGYAACVTRQQAWSLSSSTPTHPDFGATPSSSGQSPVASTWLAPSLMENGRTTALHAVALVASGAK